MNMHASNLDIEKFRKVHALMIGGATEGERAAAKNRCEAIAKKAGMTLKQALSKLDGHQSKRRGSGSSFADMCREQADRMEREERERKEYERRTQEEAIRQAQERERERERERQRKFATRRAEILAEFGSVKAFLDHTMHEKLILEAIAPFIEAWGNHYKDVCGTKRRDVKSFGGVSGHFVSIERVAPEALAVIKGAYPFPDSLSGLFEELRCWDKLERERAHFYPHGEYYFDPTVEVRISLLRNAIETQPAQSWHDLEIRFHYKAYAWQQQWISEQDFDDPEWARLYADFQHLRAASEAVHVGQQENNPPDGKRTMSRSNAEVRKAVLSMLDTNPELSDREISRRVGVSPQTVGNWRKRVSA